MEYSPLDYATIRASLDFGDMTPEKSVADSRQYTPMFRGGVPFALVAG